MRSQSAERSPRTLAEVPKHQSLGVGGVSWCAAEPPSKPQRARSAAHASWLPWERPQLVEEGPLAQLERLYRRLLMSSRRSSRQGSADFSINPFQPQPKTSPHFVHVQENGS